MNKRAIIGISVLLTIAIVAIGGYYGYAMYQSYQFESHMKQAEIADKEAMVFQNKAINAYNNKDFINASFYANQAYKKFGKVYDNLTYALHYTKNPVYRKYIDNDISRIKLYGIINIKIMENSNATPLWGTTIPQYKLNITIYENNMKQIKSANSGMFKFME